MAEVEQSLIALSGRGWAEWRDNYLYDGGKPTRVARSGPPELKR